MTLILCEKHGASNFFESCEHVRDLILNGRYEDIKEIRAYAYRMKVCETCVKQYQLEKYVIENLSNFNETMSEPSAFWKDLENADDKMQHGIAWCTHCYDDLLENINY